MTDIELINKFTRRELNEDEIYKFEVILCDNQIDRDNERFSIDALSELKNLFVGKTGIFDHNPKGENQTARIYKTELSTDDSKNVENGEKYTCLKAGCYMVRTDSNKDLILEIDGGIKKEVSVSCQCKKKICSICGKNRLKSPCRHEAGKIYSGKKCCFVLDDATDAYEWSFVAVPAQQNAGITKKFRGDESYSNTPGNPDNSESTLKMLKLAEDEVRKDIVRLSYLGLNEVSRKAMNFVLEQLSLEQMFELKENLMDICKKGGTLQLGKEKVVGNNVFKI